MTPNADQATHDIRCRELVEVITDLLEGRLAPDERDLVERHLAMCTWCQTYLDQMRDTLAAVGRLGRDDVPEALVDSLARVFRASVSGGGPSGRTRQGDDPARQGGLYSPGGEAPS